MKIIIRGGHVVDPANHTDSIQDLYISGAKICAPYGDGQAERIIDAAGMTVCPGFIDMHMHEDPVLPGGSIYKDEERAIFNCMLRMGVTSAVAGNCGENRYHPADYLDLVDKQGAAVNVGMLAGHEFFRFASGADDRYAPANAAQRAQTAREMEKCLERGCLGLSYGIRYVPAMDMAELLETADGVLRQGGIIAAHIRSDAGEVFDSAREFLDAGLKLSVPLQLSHIGSMAGFGQMERFLKLVDQYRRVEPRICCDCYPYDAFATCLGSTTYDDGWLERYSCDYSVVELAEGKYKGQRCTKAIFDEVRREHPQCISIAHVMQQSEVDMAYTHPGTVLGSDGSLNAGQGHPRAAGAFPRFIARYVRGGRMSMTEAINTISALPARQLGLSGKGRLDIGADADVVIFNANEIEDRSSFEQPVLPPVGIRQVIVNGVIAAENGKILSFDSGRAIRKE